MAGNAPLADIPLLHYAAGMDRPWFRRFAGFSYRPICWQGWTATAGTLVTAVPLGLLFVYLSDDDPVLSWLSAGFGAAIVAGYHALVVWKLERDYGS